MSSQPSIDDVLRFAKPTATFRGGADLRLMQKLCEACKRYLRLRLANLVSQHANGHVLVKMYSSDGTPLLLNRAWTAMLGERKISRHGRRMCEYLIERSHYQGVDSGGKKLRSVLMRDPVPLGDKAGWTLFGCMLDSSPSLRSLGFSGPALSHYVWDRGCYSVLDRTVRQYHRNENAEALGPCREVQGLLNFVCTRADVLHDCASAFNWGIRGFCDGECMRDLYIVILSIRNAYSILMEHVHSWLSTAVDFRSSSDLPSADILSTLWRGLGVGEETSVVLVRYRALFQEGRLLAATEAQADPSFVDRILGALMGVWRFVTFSDSRWLSVGVSARAVIASLLTGVESLITFARRVKQCSEYHIHGIDRLRPHVRSLCAISALCSCVGESLLAALISDDRVMCHVEQLEDTVATEMQYLSDWPYECWVIVASVTDCTVMELRSKTMYAASVTVGHVNEQVFVETRRYPWRLCRGDKSRNLDELALGARPDECVASQLWDLMRINYPRACLEEVLHEIQRLPWSSIGAEQGHAAAAQVKRHHHDLHEDSLMCRSLLYSMQSLLSASEHTIRLQRLSLQISGLKQVRQKCWTGRMAFLSECFDMAKRLLPPGRALPRESGKHLVRTHAEVFSAFDDARKDWYAQKASLMGLAKRTEVLEQLRDLEEEADLLQMRGESEDASRNTWCLSACTLSEIERLELEQLLRSDQFPRLRVAQLREIARRTPRAPDVLTQLAIRSHIIPRVERPEPPVWIREVAARREHFVLHALLVKPRDGAEDATMYFEFMYAYQSPVKICLQCLERSPRATPASGASLIDNMMNDWEYEFVGEGRFVYSVDALMCAWTEDMVDVLPGLVYLGQHRVASHSSPMPLRLFLDALPVVRGARAGLGAAARGPGPPTAAAMFLAEHPWAVQYIDEAARWLEKQRGAVEAEADEDPSDEVVSEELAFEVDDAVIGEVSAAMEAARAEAAPDHAGSFRVLPLGGVWLAAHAGIHMDAWQGKAVGREPSDFCRRYRLQAAARFDVGLYSHRGALVCARFWVQRMAFFFDTWVAAGAVLPYAFGVEDTDAWREPAEFTLLTTTCLATKAQRRFGQLRALWPVGNGLE